MCPALGARPLPRGDAVAPAAQALPAWRPCPGWPQMAAEGQALLGQAVAGGAARGREVPASDWPRPW